MFWMAEKRMNVGVVQEIFSDTPYHLNSILMMAHMNRMNEDFNTGADLIGEHFLNYSYKSLRTLFFYAVSTGAFSNFFSFL